MNVPTQELVLTSSPDGGPIKAYDASSGAILARFSGSRTPRCGLALAGKSYIVSSHISSTTNSGSIHLYTWWSSKPHHQIPAPEPIGPVATTPNGSYLFAGGVSGTIHSIKIPSGEVVRSFSAHSKAISCLEIIDDGSVLVSGSDDGAIVISTIFKLVSVAPDEKANEIILHSVAAHPAPITKITCSMMGCNSLIISSSLDYTIKFWDLMSGTPLRTISFPCPVLVAAVNPIESMLYAAGSDGLLYTAALNVTRHGCKPEAWSQKHEGTIVSIAMVNGLQNLISASDDGCVQVWDVEKGEMIKVLADEHESLSSLVIAKGSKGIIGNGFRNRDDGGCWASGLLGAEMRGPVSGIGELEEALSSVDKSKAIDQLESAIGMYEKLLELMLKEAKGGSSSKNKD